MNDRFSQLFKFGIVGVLNTAVDFAVFTALTFSSLSYMPAQWISYSCGVANSYLWNRSWTFKRQEKRDPKEIAKFIGVNVITLLFSLLILNGLHAGLEMPLWISKLMATIVSVGLNYVGSRYWVFHSRSD